MRVFIESIDEKSQFVYTFFCLFDETFRAVMWLNIEDTASNTRKYTNQGSRISLGNRLKGDNNEITKVHYQCIKLSFSRITGPVSTKLYTKYP